MLVGVQHLRPAVCRIPPIRDLASHDLNASAATRFGHRDLLSKIASFGAQRTRGASNLTKELASRPDLATTHRGQQPSQSDSPPYLPNILIDGSGGWLF